jgi:type I restriction enzyme S subunit
MKNGWKIVPMGKLCSISSGESDTQDSVPDGLYAFFDRSKIIKRSSRFLYDCEALIIPGEGKEFFPKYFKGKFDLHQRAYALFDFLPDLDVRFLYHLLHYRSDYFPSVAVGATVKSLRRRHFEDLPVPVPPLPTQQRIVGILDEAFAGIATAKANAEKNLQNAPALFESHLQSVFTQRGKGWKQKPLAELCESSRVITYGVIKLGDEVPTGVPCLRTSNVRWLRIDTEGMKRIAPRLSLEYSRTILKGGEVLVNVRGTLGGVAVASREMAGWNVSREVAVVPIDSKRINPEFLGYLIGSGTTQQWLGGVKKGAAYVGINIEDLRLLPVSIPSMAEQREIVSHLESLHKETQHLASIYEWKLAALEALKKSLLYKAFNGELTEQESESVIIPFPVAMPNIAPIDLHAGILAVGYKLHEKRGTLKFYGHVKTEKISHMMEALVGIDLGRVPVQDAAGPNDFPHLKKVEHRARMAKFFTFHERTGGGYRMAKGSNFNSLIAKTRAALGELNQKVEDLINLMVSMTMQQAEIFATVFAAWNNLLLENKRPSDEEIVLAARENWHPKKLEIPRDKFFKAIGWMREKGICPEGKGKKVVPKAARS